MIEIKNLKKSFGEKNVLTDVSLKINDSKVTCIIGKSGCGKSVLLKHIVGLLLPDSGSISVNGADIVSMSSKKLYKLRKKMGYVFQSAALFDSYTVYENVVIGLFEHGERDEAMLRNEAQRTLSAVGLLPNIEEKENAHFQKEWAILADKKPSDLSGGMRKRVGVARALVGSPEYILYDEPTTGLDPVNSEQIDDLVKDINHKLKVTSIVITHDMFSVYRIADRVAMLNAGVVHFEGDVEQLRHSTDPVVKEFISRFE